MSTEPRIWSLRRGTPTPPARAVRVDRGTAWGNPYRMARESERDAVCDRFEQYARARLAREPHWLDPLSGRDLLCWCRYPGQRPPKRCHAQTLLRLANHEPAPALEEEQAR